MVASQMVREWLQALPSPWRRRLERVAPLAPTPRIIVCFGSRWGGLPRPDSDYDVLMIGDSPLAPGELMAIHRAVRRAAPDVDWRWLSLRGAQAHRLIHPALSWALRPGHALGDVGLLGPQAPMPATSLRLAAQDILDDLEAVARLDDPWDEDGRAYRRVTKRLVVLEQLLDGEPDARALALEVAEIMAGAHPHAAIARRAERVIACTRALPLNAGDAPLRRAVHEQTR